MIILIICIFRHVIITLYKDSVRDFIDISVWMAWIDWLFKYAYNLVAETLEFEDKRPPNG